MLDLDQNEPNAWLCAKCYREHDVAEDRFNGEVDLDSSYKFSNVKLTHNQLSSSHRLQSSNYPCGSLNEMVLVKYPLHPAVKHHPPTYNEVLRSINHSKTTANYMRCCPMPPPLKFVQYEESPLPSKSPD